LKAILDRFMTQPMPSVPMQAGYFTLSQADVLSLLPGGIEVDYQPLHDPMTGEIRAMEALARMRHPTYGLIGPAIFVPICERAGAATLLLRAVLAASSTFLAKLHAAGHDDLKIAINVSSADLTTPDLVGEISGVVEKAGIHPSSVILELTESRALDETTLPTEILTRLRVRGFGLAVDDFGTGYASLKQLGAIPFTELKIDQTFVRGAYNDEKKRLMLRSTLDLARELSLLTVAEGVETEADLELVRSMGVDLIQGFHLSKPMRPEKLLELLG
jgi:EAL domain-containing protein (putative c-di-GMP-specific phosphodiesterase class I)